MGPQKYSGPSQIGENSSSGKIGPNAYPDRQLISTPGPESIRDSRRNLTRVNAAFDVAFLVALVHRTWSRAFGPARQAAAFHFWDHPLNHHRHLAKSLRA